jgi:acyl-CoA reductase-like NAD-dependent aldehyde dehydrogenase
MQPYKTVNPMPSFADLAEMRNTMTRRGIFGPFVTHVNSEQFDHLVLLANATSFHISVHKNDQGQRYFKIADMTVQEVEGCDALTD